MTVLIYGAYGYTGELIAREAVDRGIEPILAGRNGTKTRGLAIELGVDSRVFDADAAEEYLDDVDVCLNCAGPFIETYEPIADACLATGTHYLDITGELPVYQGLLERDREAEQADVCLLPGVGFDVVPTDCLAAHLHDRLPGATHLRLGFDAPTSFSGGTLASVVEMADQGGRVRRDGQLRSVPVAGESRTIDFGNGPRNAVTIPWGDVATAYVTTGIPNIDVWAAMPAPAAAVMRGTNYATPILGLDPVKDGLKTLVRALIDGPSDRKRETERVFVWGEASNGDKTVTSRLVTPEQYALTVDAATTILERIEADGLPTGFQTPGTIFGPEFVLELDGVEGYVDETVPEAATR